MSTTTVSGAARKARGRGEERREEILAHARRLFARHGVQTVTTRQIAEAVGISQASLYAYFPGKPQLLDEVSSRAFRDLHSAADAARLGAGDPVADMIRAYIRFGIGNPDAYRIAFMIEPPCPPGAAPPGYAIGPAGPAAKGGAAMQAFDGLRRCLADRLGADHPDLEVTAQSLWAGMHGLVALFLARPGFPWVERQALIDRHVRMLLCGLPGGGSAAVRT